MYSCVTDTGLIRTIMIMSVLALTISATWESTSSALNLPTTAQSTTDVIIDVKTRKFEPEMISLQRGKKIRLILRNKDAELHAFVPVGLFLETTHQVSGNGAPQFGNEGLLRVLLPPIGQTEISFTPENAGTFPFLCDLPGHVMQGTIVVQE
ncbi:MAG: hypothetical protein NPIRA01_17660 [Nitrospirales bacterium]|nr:MAG: hypothetical protein NPIRA01_17660 [Nitrospirales bacterium]